MEDRNLLDQTVAIVTSWARTNTCRPEDLAATVGAVHKALQALANAEAAPDPAEQRPAVPVRKSVTPDYIVCLEDGRKLKTLKRHLRTVYGMTPDDYRQKWGLPYDYPMVAPNYAAERSAAAKKLGLGLRNRPAAQSPAKPARGTARRRRTPRP